MFDNHLLVSLTYDAMRLTHMMCIDGPLLATHDEADEVTDCTPPVTTSRHTRLSHPVRYARCMEGCVYFT